MVSSLAMSSFSQGLSSSQGRYVTHNKPSCLQSILRCPNRSSKTCFDAFLALSTLSLIPVHPTTAAPAGSFIVLNHGSHVSIIRPWLPVLQDYPVVGCFRAPVAVQELPLWEAFDDSICHFLAVLLFF